MHFRVHHLSVKHRVLERAQDNIPSFQAFCGENRKSKCAFGILKGVAETSELLSADFANADTISPAAPE
jgi:hypothetical protein